MEAGMVASGTRVPGAKDRAYEAVKQKILNGELPGGELVSEGEIAASLAMSRTPVREAFLRLESEGLLRLYPQRGALVVPVSPDEIRSVFESRLVLEQFAVRKATARDATARSLLVGRLREQVVEQERAVESGRIGTFLESDRLFHGALLDSAGNELMSGFYASLRDRQVRMIGESAVRDSRRIATILAEHRDIVAAIAEGDAGRGADAVRHHLQGTVSALGLVLDQAQDPGPAGA